VLTLRYVRSWRFREALDNLITANVLISNVRGPNEPLYLSGARLEALCPVSTLLAGMGLNITLILMQDRS
jgi:hypothetical protein